MLIEHFNDWTYCNDEYYHNQFPEYKIKVKWDEDVSVSERYSEYYHRKQIDQSTKYGNINLYYYNTQLDSFRITLLDGGRMIVPCPQREYATHNENNILPVNVCYFIENSMETKIIEFFKNKKNNSEANYALYKFIELVLIFETYEEKCMFFNFVNQNQEIFITLYSAQDEYDIETDINNRFTEMDLRQVKTVLALKEMQKNWKSNFLI